MKPKRKRATKKPRQTWNRRILELLKSNPEQAMAMAHSGPELDKVEAWSETHPLQGDTLPAVEAWMLALQYGRQAQRQSQGAEMPEELRKAICAAAARGDGDFFRTLADTTEAMDRLCRSLRGPGRRGIAAARCWLIGALMDGQPVNLSEVARRCRVTVRTVWKLNQEIGAKPMNPGRPGK